MILCKFTPLNSVLEGEKNGEKIIGGASATGGKLEEASLSLSISIQIYIKDESLEKNFTCLIYFCTVKWNKSEL